MLLNQQTAKLDPRVKRTRKLLQQAFQELLTEKDFASITVQDIAERAEVNRATFYAHFDDKFGLLDYSIRESFQEALDKRLPSVQAFTLENVRALTITVADFVGRFLGHCHPSTLREEKMRIGLQVQHLTCEILSTWLSNAEDRSDESLATIASGLGWLIFGSAFQSTMAHNKQSPEQLADELIAFIKPSLQAYLVEPASA